MDMLSIIECLIAGSFAGLLAGLLGIGGGLIVVPLLMYLLPNAGVAPELVMPSAIATSLATVCMTTLSSSRAHAKQRLVTPSLALSVLPGLSLGALLGAVLVTVVDPLWLQRIFATMLVLLALRMLLRKVKPLEPAEHSGGWIIRLGTLVIGTVSALVGIGGGALTVPFLQRQKIPVRTAIAVSSMGSFTIGVSSVAMFIILGWVHDDKSTSELGLIFWPAWIAISCASVVAARQGAKLVQRLPVRRLQQIFALFLLVVGGKLLLF